MTKLLFTLLALGLYLNASAQCQADFSYTVNNGTVSFTNTSTGMGLFNSWTFGDGNNSYQSSPTHTYTTTGTYVVCLSIYDSLSQCQDSYCDSIFVQADTTGGSGCNVTSNAYANPNGTIIGTASGASMYNWIVYDNSWNYLYDVNNGNLNYNPGSNGTYNVCLTAYDNLQNICDSTCYSVTVMDSTGGGGSGCLTSSSASINPNGVITGSASGAIMYNWIIYDAGWNYVYDTNNPNFTYQATPQQTYNVCLTAYDSLQFVCDSICYTVGDSLAGLNVEDEIVFNIYPNPTQSIVYLETSKEHISAFVLMDITGAVLLQQEITATTTEIDLSLYPKGMYFIHALGRKGQRLSTSKVLRQ
ncbi:MAG: T9SS type A sorting domain-containing protein [bacterium]|nr:T9SS type A sorting domain-containing protein [bacterium]